MKLLTIGLARTQWWGHMADFNPKGIAFYPLIMTFLIKTYKFKIFPDPTKIPAPGVGLKFERGEFAVKEDFLTDVALSVYNDGLTADTYSSTDHSDAFLLDVWTHFTEIFKSPDYNEVIRKKTHLSQLYVSTDKSLQTVNPKLRDFAQLLSVTISNEQPEAFYELGGVSFWADSVAGISATPFAFERAMNVPFSENRYYSAAPLQTGQHLELLDRLEDILS
jgi:hypothetical protein